MMGEQHAGGTAPSFSLATQPWVTCQMASGATQDLSLSEVFTQCRDIVRLAGETPAQDLALLRLLLVIFWRAHRDNERLDTDDAETKGEWWLDALSGAVDLEGPVNRYLQAWTNRWDLLHPSTPFFQVPDLHTAKGTHDSLRKLIPDAESDYFSVRAGRGLDRISCAEAARWLVHLQAWNYSGIKSGAVGDPRVKGGKGYPIGTGWSGRSGGVVLHGASLAETLVLNTPATHVFSDAMEQDLPAWERSPDTAAPRSTEVPAGPCDLLTWQIRRARLFGGPDGITGVLVANGDRVEMMNMSSDPMTAYAYSRNQSSKGLDVYLPKRHAETRTLWRGMEPLLARSGRSDDDQAHSVRVPQTVQWLQTLRGDGDIPKDLLIGVELVGMLYGTQDATVTGTVHDELPLRLGILIDGDDDARHFILHAVDTTTRAVIAVGQFRGRLDQAAGGDYTFGVDDTDALLAGMNDPFKAWLGALTAESPWPSRLDQWFSTVRTRCLQQARLMTVRAGQPAVIGREDADGRLVSTSSAWIDLQRRLDQLLGRLDHTAETSGSTERTHT